MRVEIFQVLTFSRFPWRRIYSLPLNSSYFKNPYSRFFSTNLKSMNLNELAHFPNYSHTIKAFSHFSAAILESLYSDVFRTGTKGQKSILMKNNISREIKLISGVRYTGNPIRTLNFKSKLRIMFSKYVIRLQGFLSTVCLKIYIKGSNSWAVKTVPVLRINY